MADSKRVAETFRAQINQVDERIPTYRQSLLDALTDVLAEERAHLIKSTNIQQKVTAICERLGDELITAGKEEKKR